MLAEHEHDRWMQARRGRAGAEPGILVHRDMRPWADLGEDRRQIDRDVVLALPEVFEEAG